MEPQLKRPTTKLKVFQVFLRKPIRFGEPDTAWEKELQGKKMLVIE